jgi:UDP-2,4-diacetamido-2,4,6-trideoxy-beta-L-altropyranose hydrolase
MPELVPLRVAFRCDASAEIGTGHVVRCLTLAVALQARGAEVCFFCRALPPGLADRLAAAGVGLVGLAPAPAPGFVLGLGDPSHARWLGLPWARDAEDTRRALADGRWDWLVVDHYALDARWERSVAPAVGRLLVIDDLADRPHDCAILLDQNLHHDADHRYDGLVPPEARRLLGPRYALLRPEFAAARARRLAAPPDPRRVFVFFGGADASDMTSRALDAMERVEDIVLDVVIGSLHPRRSSIEARCAAHAAWSCAVDVADMADRMAQAAVGLGAGGTTTWERCAVGLPSLVVSVADNQVEIAAACAAAGVQLDLGWGPSLDPAKLRSVLLSLLEDHGQQRAVAEAARGVCSGEGALLVVDHMVGRAGLRLRPTRAEDAALLFHWANEPSTRRASLSSAPVRWESHVAWLAARLHDPAHALFVLEQGEEALGQVRFADEGDRWRLSYGLDPRARGRGLGRQLVTAGLAAIAGRGPVTVLAEVKADNVASIETFRRLAWQEGAHGPDGLHRFTTPRPSAPPQRAAKDPP